MKQTLRTKPRHYIQLDSYRRAPEVHPIIYWGMSICTVIMLVTAGIYSIEKYSQEDTNVCSTSASAYYGPGC
jgi:hypothetical protein